MYLLVYIHSEKFKHNKSLWGGNSRHVLKGSLMFGGVMQELDVQNAAAAEQHARDMAEYDAKVAEAAAAWEADKKKRKGKAKDEVSSLHF